MGTVVVRLGTRTTVFTTAASALNRLANFPVARSLQKESLLRLHRLQELRQSPGIERKVLGVTGVLFMELCSIISFSERPRKTL